MEETGKTSFATPPPQNVVSGTRPKDGEQLERAENSIHVSVARAPKFYSRLGAFMLHGAGDRKRTHDEIFITGLGLATRCAISAACILEREKQGCITRIETSYFASTRGNVRRVPKITITIAKTSLPPSPNGPAAPQEEFCPVAN